MHRALKKLKSDLSEIEHLISKTEIKVDVLSRRKDKNYRRLDEAGARGEKDKIQSLSDKIKRQESELKEEKSSLTQIYEEKKSLEKRVGDVEDAIRDGECRAVINLRAMSESEIKKIVEEVTESGENSS